ncbi:MAG: matrixin family metalloprotease, partial [Planctomycetota bacterium]
NYPGAVGATLAMWKAAVEWDSLPHGDGTGDGTQPVIGSGGVNLDHTYQGTAASAGVPGDNIASATGPGCGTACGGVTEFAAGGGVNGWRIRINDSQLAWDDAPGAINPALYDIQSTTAHEFGHTVGLGHSSGTGCVRPTMVGGPIAGDACRRSIEVDDIGGIQAVYGLAAATKPVVTGISGATFPGSLLTIQGSNFAATGNEVWFTKAAPDGNPLVVAGLSSTGGGTALAVTVPGTAADGDLLVKITAGTGGSALSNPWPVDIGSGPAPVPSLASVSPPSAEILANPMPTITLTGTDLGAVSSATVGGTVLSGPSITVSPTQVTFALPLLPLLGPTAVSVTAPGGTSNALTLQV